MAKIINGRAVADRPAHPGCDYEKMNESAILGWRRASLFPCAMKRGYAISALRGF